MITTEKPGVSSHEYIVTESENTEKATRARRLSCALAESMEVLMTDLRTQSEGFSFYRVPRQLVKGREYRPLSPAGKLLFGLLLDRVSLSVKNGWRDGKSRTYVYYAVAEICEDFGCSRVTGGKLLSELERIGLIERKKQGQGKPDRIYVLQFCAKPDF